VLNSSKFALLFSKGAEQGKEALTKNEYFPMHISFSTIYSLQEMELNPRNYHKEEFIMEIFVRTTNNDMNMHAKI
jgi:hypothetical protein